MTAASIRGLSESEEDRAFLQRRVALFGLCMGGCYLLFWLYRLITLLLFGRPEDFAHPSFLWHLAAAQFFLLPWFLCRSGKRSTRFISAVDLAALSLGVLATSAMSMYIPLERRPDFIILLALTYVMLGRSIFVPCTGRSTLILGTISGRSSSLAVYVRALGLDWQKWSTLYPELAELTAARAAVNITIEIAAWWVLTTTLATMTSVVIYGLRCRVRDAEQLGQYRLEEKLGEGGMGVVYRASHAFLRRPYSREAPAAREGGRRQPAPLRARGAAHCKPNAPQYDHDFRLWSHVGWALLLCDGIHRWIESCRTSSHDQRAQHQGRVADLMRQTASALVEAHGIGLVHRDIKPSNVMVHLLHPHGGAGDCVKVLDFGLVKEVRREGGIELTNEASLSGTPQYMAPESITSPNTVDARADLYALGAVAYYLLTGTHVFTGKSIVEVASHHLHSAPEPLSSRLGKPIVADLEQLVLDCLAKDPSDRPQSALELEQRLSECASVLPWTSEDARRWWAVHGELSRKTPPPEGEGMLTIDVALTSRAGRG